MGQKNVILNRSGISINGQYRTLLCASLFYFRIPRELWLERIRQLKECGYNCADVYFPWNYHETAPDEWTFEDNADAGEFLRLLAEEGVFVVARPGPYICSEWDGGSLPAWVLASGSPVRENHPDFLKEVKTWYDRIIPIISKYEIGRGGTVILLQLENELDYFDCPSPTEYMCALRNLACEAGAAVTIFGCAGQGSVERAIGFADGVLPTYNFYPDGDDAGFDGNLLRLATALADKDIPLLITETHGYHFLLRREFANGAKLLGAYNQVAGNNFGFTNSINNWGQLDRPLALIASSYGAGMISPYGEYTPAALEGRVFSAFLRTFGEKLATSEARFNTHFSVFKQNGSDFTAHTRLLVMPSGGSFLCIPNFSDEESVFIVSGGAISFKVTVPGHAAPFMPIGVPLPFSSLEIVWACTEVIDIYDQTIVCWGEGDAAVCLRQNGGIGITVNGAGEHQIPLGDGINATVRIISGAEAGRYERNGLFTAHVGGETEVLSIAEGCLANSFLEFCPISPAEPATDSSLAMESLGLYRGAAEYHVEANPQKPLLLSDVADFISAYAGEVYVGTRLSAGEWQKYDPVGETAWKFRLESWGHCNFDDSRLPSLRLISRKGISGAYIVQKEEAVEGWRFVLLDKWDETPNLTFPKSALDPYLNPNAWNSTRMPLIAAYYTTFHPEGDCRRFVAQLPGNNAETCIYVNGVYAGRFLPAAPWIDITSHVRPGIPCELILLTRKRNWDEQVGMPVIYHLTSAAVGVSALTDKDFAYANPPDTRSIPEVSLPLSLRPGDLKTLVFPLDSMRQGCAYAKVVMSDMKLTAVYNNKVVGRIIGEWGGVDIRGGAPDEFYLPGPWRRAEGNLLTLYLEAIGSKPILEKLDLRYIKNY